MRSHEKPHQIPARIMACCACALALLAGAVAFLFFKTPAQDLAWSSHRKEVIEPMPSPTLHCLFSDFTHASVVVGFDFAVALPEGAPPRFAERAEAVRNDPAVDFDVGSRPAWAYRVDEDGTKTIASPDGATRILLYGLKLGSGDTSWIEAGIRSNIFRNLDGKCLQSHFDVVDHGSVTKAPAR